LDDIILAKSAFDGIDKVLDFNPAKGDVMEGNCELF
jgi:hypothetical protein